MKKEIGNQMPCIKEEMWKWVKEAWYSVAPNFLEELYNSMPRRIADIMIANGAATKYWLYDVGQQVYCCVFIGMYLKYDVVFSLESIWYLQMLSVYTSIWFIEVKFNDN